MSTDNLFVTIRGISLAGGPVSVGHASYYYAEKMKNLKTSQVKTQTAVQPTLTPTPKIRTLVRLDSRLSIISKECAQPSKAKTEKVAVKEKIIKRSGPCPLVRTTSGNLSAVIRDYAFKFPLESVCLADEERENISPQKPVSDDLSASSKKRKEPAFTPLPFADRLDSFSLRGNSRPSSSNVERLNDIRLSTIWEEPEQNI